MPMVRSCAARNAASAPTYPGFSIHTVAPASAKVRAHSLISPDQRGYSPGARPKARRGYRTNLLGKPKYDEVWLES